MAAHTLIPLDDRAAWTSALDGVPHAFGHTWESCAAMRLTTGHPTFLYVFEEGATRVVCALAEREHGGARDVVTPYGFGGFTGTGEAPGFPEAWHAFARDRGWVCGYIGLNPLLVRGSYIRADDADAHTEIYVLDLAGDDAALLARVSENRRRELRAWERETSPAFDREELADFFVRHYPAFMRARGASRTYDFADETWAALVATPRVELLGAARGGRLEAVTMLAHTPWIGEYLFHVALPEARGHAGPLLLVGARRLRHLGVPVLNLGGGVTPGDGVARFKQRFGARALPLGRLRQVYDRDRFVHLCRRSGVPSGSTSGYFPPYYFR